MLFRSATISFTVPQAVAVAEAVERGLKRREAEGKPTDQMSPVCTIMIGRVDDWMKAIAAKRGTLVDPECLELAGVAVCKNAYRIYKERGYRTRLLLAAYRNHYHWSEFIGGDICMTIPYPFQRRINPSGVEVKDRINDPVDPAIIKQLRDYFPDFIRAYEPDGMKPEEFQRYGAFVETLHQFLQGYEDFVHIIRGIIVPDAFADCK